jgi:hypothetical protein
MAGGGKAMLLRRVRFQYKEKIKFAYFQKTKKRLRQRGEKTIVKEHQSASGSAAWVDRKNGLSAGVQGGGGNVFKQWNRTHSTFES